MAVTLAQFVENLTQSGLMSVAELSVFREGLAPDKRPQDAQGLARELILAGKLTRYPAAAVYHGKTRGLVLGEYTVLDQLGAGGMGQVLKAQHRKMKRIVALKTLPPRAMRSPEMVKRFHREVRAAARLAHPNIVAAFDAGEADGIHFLVMQSARCWAPSTTCPPSRPKTRTRPTPGPTSTPSAARSTGC